MRITLQRDDMNSSKVNVKKDEPWYILGTHVIKTILVLESTRLFIGQLKCTIQTVCIMQWCLYKVLDIGHKIGEY